MRTQKSFQQTKNKFHVFRFIKFLVLIIFFIFVIKIAFAIPKFISNISKPYPALSGDFINRGSVSFDFRNTLLLASLDQRNIKELALGSFSKKEKALSVIHLNPESLIFTHDGAQQLKDLVDNEKNWDKMASKLTEILGFPIDGYLLTTSSGTWVNQDNLEAVISNINSPSFFINFLLNKNGLAGSLKTNLGLGELRSLANLSKEVKGENIGYYDFTKSAVTSDGYLDNQVIANRLGIKWQDVGINNENLTVEVVNASAVEGMDLIVKKIIINMGATVLQTSSITQLKETTIYTDKKDSKLASRLKTFLTTNLDDLPKDSAGFDMKVVVGEDYAKYFNF